MAEFSLRLRLFWLPVIAGLLWLSACAPPPPTTSEVTRVIKETVIVTRVVRQLVRITSTPLPAPALTQTAQACRPPATPTSLPLYYPLKDCPPSHLAVGLGATVSMGGGRNAIRWTADVTTGENIIGYAAPGEYLEIIGGPECSFGWLLWEVRAPDGQIGWTPETDGKRYFLDMALPFR